MEMIITIYRKLGGGGGEKSVNFVWKTSKEDPVRDT